MAFDEDSFGIFKMAHGGRRKGAGRPRFHKAAKTSYFATRLTPEMRKLLEKEARRQGKSLSVVAESLLRSAVGQRTPSPLQSILFLFEAAARIIPAVHEGEPKYFWRTNPYFFEAFRAAILRILDAVRPDGEIVTPPPGPIMKVADEDEEPWPFIGKKDAGAWQFTYPDSPERYGRLSGELVLRSAAIQRIRDKLDKEHPDLGFGPKREDLRDFYGLIDAVKNLNLQSGGEKEAN